ncbi:MAG: hypothetical protein AAFW87_14135, partial [Pseudomonadota bacterium]
MSQDEILFHLGEVQSKLLEDASDVAVPVRMNIAAALLHLQMFDRAKPLYAQIVSKKPAFNPAHLGMIDCALGMQDFDAALALADDALARWPRNQALLSRRVVALARLGDREPATVAASQLASSSKVQDEATWIRTAKVLGDVGLPAVAEQMLSRITSFCSLCEVI